ncbi:MAG: helix-turn-helix domain-containing protein [Acutalibacteraceae bacterium]
MFVDYKEVGRRIAQRRKELGLKQAEVCESAELSDKYLSNIERATSIMSIDVLMRICEALDTTPNYLLLGATESHSNQGYEKHFLEKIQALSDRQKETVYSFVDWISQQETC